MYGCAVGSHVPGWRIPGKFGHFVAASVNSFLIRPRGPQSQCWFPPPEDQCMFPSPKEPMQGFLLPKNQCRVSFSQRTNAVFPSPKEPETDQTKGVAWNLIGLLCTVRLDIGLARSYNWLLNFSEASSTSYRRFFFFIALVRPAAFFISSS
jgi:hypothetical protein